MTFQPKASSSNPGLPRTFRHCSGGADMDVNPGLPEAVDTCSRNGPGSASSAGIFDLKALRSMSKKQLWTLASQTPGVSRNKRTSEGKWAPKRNAQLITDFLALKISTWSLAGGRPAAEKARQERKNTLKKTETYKAKRRLLERYPKCKFAKRARRNQEKHKEQKRQYERAPKAKVSRVQRKAARFWAPCLSNWRAMDQEGDIDEQTRAANSGAAYAPRFHPDGRVSIIQGGAEKFLPCPLEPSKGADQEQGDLGQLIAEGWVSPRRWEVARSGTAEPHKTKGRQRSAENCQQSFIITGRLRRCTHHCPMAVATWRELNDMASAWAISWGDIAQDLSLGVPGSASDALPVQWDPEWASFGEGRPPCPCDVCLPDPEILPSLLEKCLPDPTIPLTKSERTAGEERFKLRPKLPEPSKYVRQFLCNAQCPKQCCTLNCPWNSMVNDNCGITPQDIVEIFGHPCCCKLGSCRKCVQERLLQRYGDPHPCSLVLAPSFTLEFPPPFGYMLYTGVGEPVSDSSVSRCAPKLYCLTCVPWGITQAGGRLPDWLTKTSFQQLSLPEFLEANGFITQSNYCLRSVGSYMDYMQPLREKFGVYAVPIKVYGRSKKNWAPEEARSWSTIVTCEESDSEGLLPASGSRDSVRQESGWEWR